MDRVAAIRFLANTRAKRNGNVFDTTSIARIMGICRTRKMHSRHQLPKLKTVKVLLLLKLKHHSDAFVLWDC